ncbi:MAG: NUDIX hydrolase [Actinomycetota bacterium]|nr:NUDIX hydrolase [Actinomycetota bacterium]
MESTYQIYANGGVVIRKSRSEEEEYFCAVVHRPRYDDWSLPKGKQDPAEEPLDCALREVLEETGYICNPLQEIQSTSYKDDHGRSKLVRYWLMIAGEGRFTPNEEVDSIAWMPFHLAKDAMTYDWDREVIASAEIALGQLQLD